MNERIRSLAISLYYPVPAVDDRILMNVSTSAIFILILVSQYAHGQPTGADSSFVRAARNQAVRQYEQALQPQAHVYEGDQYINHDPRIKVHPFYQVDSLQMGTVVYRGVTYRDVPMLYDIVRDELVVQPPGGGYRLRLRTDKIAAFSLGPHQFSRLVSDSLAGVRTGFYEVIYAGRVNALAKRQKTVHEDISSGSYKADYLTQDRYLIQKEGIFYPVKTKRSVLALFPDQARGLRKYLRTNHLKFRDEQRGQTIAQLTQQYDELTH